MCKKSLSGKRVKVPFTLIELLVVSAIIAILAAILMPALSSARARANGNHCTNNLKQCMLAIQMYIDDHKSFPLYYYPGTNNRTFREMICKRSMQRYGTAEQKKFLGGNYLQNEKQTLCNARYPFEPQNSNATYKQETSMGWHISSYGSGLSANVRPTPYEKGSEDYEKLRDNMRFDVTKDHRNNENTGILIRPPFIKNPSLVYMLADSASVAVKNGEQRNVQRYWIDFSSCGFLGAHNGRANISWLDGHVDSNDAGTIKTKLPSLKSSSKVLLDMASYEWIN